MDNTSTYKETLKELPVQLKLDLYVEVIIASLIEEGKLDASRLYIKPKGTFKRSFKKDLELVEVIDHKKTAHQSVYFYINREGLYDMLPEGLFHKNLRKTKHIDTEESVQELKLHQEEEKHARNFFLPLEQEFYQQRIQIEIEEQKSLVGVSEFIIQELMANFWHIKFPLEHYQSLCLAYMLPMMHRIVGNFELTRRCLEIILQTSVKLEEKNPKPVPVVEAHQNMGLYTLGETLILGDILVKEVNDLQISVGPLASDDLLDYLEGGKKLALVELLCAYFLPAEVDWDLELLVKEDEIFELASERNSGLLNYTTLI